MKGIAMKTGISLRPMFVVMMVFFLVTPSLVNGHETNKSVDENSLYVRMGGYDVISNVIDDFLTKSWADPRISHFFVGMGTDTRNRLRQKNKNLMCFTTGGPCRVLNRPLEVVHVGLGITDTDFYIIVDHIMVSLKKFDVPDNEREQLHAKLLSLKPKIVNTTEVPLSAPKREGMKETARMANALGISNFNIGRFDEALSHFQDASKEDSGVGEYHFNEAMALDKLGKHSLAAKHFGAAQKNAHGNNKIIGSKILKAHVSK
jgi:hemoglobin